MLVDAEDEYTGMSQSELQYMFDKITCPNVLWVGNASCEFLTIIAFLLMVKRIDHKVKLNMKKQIKTYGYSERHFEPELKKLDNLWFIVRFFLVVDTYIFLYNWVSFIQARILSSENENNVTKICNVVTGYEQVDEYFWLFKRLALYSVWQIPIIFIFWPKKARLDQERQVFTKSEVSLLLH